MAKRSRRSGTKLPPFVAMPWKVLNSGAYEKLPFSARAALPYFLGKPKIPFNDAGYHSAIFEFTYTEAERYGFSKGTFSSVINNLIRFGFIDPVEKGGMRGHSKSGNKFKLSKRWEKFGQNDFIEMSWKSFVDQ